MSKKEEPEIEVIRSKADPKDRSSETALTVLNPEEVPERIGRFDGELKELVGRAAEFKVIEPDDPKRAKDLRQTRLDLRRARLNVSKVLDEVVAPAKQFIKDATGYAEDLIGKLHPDEKRLKELEDGTSEEIRQRVVLRRNERQGLLRSFGQQHDAPLAVLDMTDEEWGIYVEEVEAAYHARLKAAEEAKAEEKRRAEAEAERKRAEDARLEQERLDRIAERDAAKAKADAAEAATRAAEAAAKKAADEAKAQAEENQRLKDEIAALRAPKPEPAKEPDPEPVAKVAAPSEPSDPWAVPAPESWPPRASGASVSGPSGGASTTQPKPAEAEDAGLRESDFANDGAGDRTEVSRLQVTVVAALQALAADEDKLRMIGVRKRDAIQLARQVHAWCPVEVR